MYPWFNLAIATCLSAGCLALAHDKIDRIMQDLKKK